ncbi:MAG: hypothetical protein FJZ01_07040 [Candidatus Sericytochromatia bacterium]|nr:hypothetical protein [Candidatus Tanganyikabacteria bacterium]
MRRIWFLLPAIALSACATVGRAARELPDFANSDAAGPVARVPDIGAVSAGSGGGSGAGGSGGGGTATATPAPGPGATPAPGGGGNGSQLLSTVAVDARKAAGTDYSPLLTVNLRGDIFYYRWNRAAFYPVKGVRDFTSSEVALLGQAVSALNAAIGRNVFELRSGGGDIPVSNEDAPGARYAGYASTTAVTPADNPGGSLGLFPDPARYYLTARIMMNFGTLPPENPQYPEYFRHVALHEMGHIAGMAHNPTTGVMNTRGDDGDYMSAGFAASERATLGLLYSTPTN